MKDTHFYLPAEKRARLTRVYQSSAGGRAEPAPDGAKGQGHYDSGPRRSFSGGAGLLSTARDYGRFLQMLLNGGSLDGVRLLSPAAVTLMSTNQIGTLYGAAGMGFGLGFSLAELPGADGFATVGTYGWGGAYATVYKIDPVERLVIVFMIQMLPNGSDLREKFPTLVYQALTDSRKR
jgi:CubicO group peptidase (beta-lactamase class C family)